MKLRSIMLVLAVVAAVLLVVTTLPASPREKAVDKAPAETVEGPQKGPQTPTFDTFLEMPLPEGCSSWVYSWSSTSNSYCVQGAAFDHCWNGTCGANGDDPARFVLYGTGGCGCECCADGPSN